MVFIHFAQLVIEIVTLMLVVTIWTRGVQCKGTAKCCNEAQHVRKPCAITKRKIAKVKSNKFK